MDIETERRIQRVIDKGLEDVAKKLPSLVHSDPASFACGYNVGYKSALLDIEAELLGGRVDELL